MITLDTVSLQNFRDQGVREVFVRLVRKGCEGTKIEVLTEVPESASLVRFEMADGFVVTCLAAEVAKLSGARITQVGKKWIFASEQVTGRCGCGSSFRFAGDTNPAPKEFLGVTLLEAGTSHELDSGNYFIYGKGVTEITVTGTVTMYSLEFAELSEIRMVLAGEQAQAELRSVVIGKSSEEYRYSSSGEIMGCSNRYVHEALILVPDHASVHAKISAMIHSKARAYRVKIHESAVFLGTTGSVRGIPELKVASDDGLASHSATTERLSGDILSYLSSRGISLALARRLYLTARISKVYAGMNDTTLKYLQEEIFKKIGL